MTTSASLASDARDVVFTFSFVTWIGAVQRGMHFPEDRLAQTLLGHPRVRRLVVANPYRSLPIYVARGLMGQNSVPFPASEDVCLFQPLRLRRRDPAGLRTLRRAYAAYDRRLARVVASMGMERPAVITHHPMVAGFADLDWAGAVTFYASDDWSAAPEYRRWWYGLEHAYAGIRERGRRVCAVSQAIIERLEPTGTHMVVPNGVHPPEWLEPGLPPPWFSQLPQPRMLYVGTLDSRLDVERIRETANAFPTGSIALVGRLADPGHVDALRAHRNVHVHPRVSRDQVTRLIPAADVCLIPHKRTRFTLAMSPLKAYEYLAGGRPVASADLPPMHGLGPRVVMAPAGRDFADAVREALNLGPAGEEERRRFITGNSWRSRHDQVLDLALA